MRRPRRGWWQRATHRGRCRAGQWSVHDTHSEDSVETAEGDAMACIGDILHLVEAQDIDGERSQSGEDTGIAANAAGILGEAAVTDVVRAVFDAPMAADGLGAGGGRQDDV